MELNEILILRSIENYVFKKRSYANRCETTSILCFTVNRYVCHISDFYQCLRPPCSGYLLYIYDVYHTLF